MAQDVLCEVNSCVHNMHGERCGATQIYVVNHKRENAESSAGTDCKTFEPLDI